MSMLETPPDVKNGRSLVEVSPGGVEAYFLLQQELQTVQHKLREATTHHKKEIRALEDQHNIALASASETPTVQASGLEIREAQSESLALHALCRALYRSTESTWLHLIRSAVREWSEQWRLDVRNAERFFIGVRQIALSTRRREQLRVRDAVLELATGAMLDRLAAVRREDLEVHRRRQEDAAVKAERIISKLRREKRELEAKCKQTAAPQPLQAAATVVAPGMRPAAQSYGEWLQGQSGTKGKWLQENHGAGGAAAGADASAMAALARPAAVKAWPPPPLQGPDGSVAWSVGSWGSPRLCLVPDGGLRGEEGREHAVFGVLRQPQHEGVGVAMGGAGGVADLA